MKMFIKKQGGVTDETKSWIYWIRCYGTKHG